MSAIYRKAEVLGWGSVAAVHAGWDELLDRPVAIKELKQPFAGNEPFSRAFRTQALRMLDISHRHVLATYAVDSDRNVHSVVRELADETVGQKSFHGPMEPDAVLRILRCALLGLDVLHGREIIHRAIKPENIFLCGGIYKIGDFGLPLLEGAPPSPVRRHRYSAPEEILTPELVSQESDLYSLGLVAYELILGPLRFEQVLEDLLRVAGERRDPGTPGGSRDEVWPRFHTSPLELPSLIDLEPGIPAAFSLTLQKMVAKNPAARFATCRQALASLGLGSPELPTGALARRTLEGAPSRPAKNGNWPWIAGGALAVSAILALSVWGLASNRSEKAPPPSLESSPSGGSVLPGDAEAPSQAGDPAGRLTRLLSQESGAAIRLHPPHSEARPLLALETPLSFRVTADRAGYLLLFAVSSDGSVACLYPNADRPSLAIRGGQTLVLPLEEDQQQGFVLTASRPLGRQLIFLLHSPVPLPPLPASQAPSSLLREYPFQGQPDDPASRFVDWISDLLRTNQEARLTALEFEVGAAR